MPGLLIKQVPDELHRQLKEQAKENHRSLAQEALTLLEKAVEGRRRHLPPKPYKGRFLLTNEWLEKAKRQGRA